MQNFRALGLRPQAPVPPAAGGFAPNPQPPALGGFASDPHWHPAAGGSAPRTPKQPPHCEFLATRLREFTKLPTGLSFFVVVASAVATMRPGAPSPTNDSTNVHAVPHERPPPILVHSECFFGSSRNDKTTGNNGKRNNNFQT